MRVIQVQKGQRNSDVIIETGLAPQNGHGFAQHRRHQLLGRRLAVGTSHSNHGCIEIMTICRGQPTQGAARLIDLDNRDICCIWNALSCLNHQCSSPFAHHLRKERVTIKRITHQRQKQVALLDFARIRADTRDEHSGITMAQPALAGLGYVLQASRLHKRLA